MLFRSPVVASNVSGIPELVGHGHNGLLVEPDRPEALADAIVQLLAQPQLGADLGRRARQTVTASFDNDRNLQRLCSLLEGSPELVADPRRGAAIDAIAADLPLEAR